MKTWMLGGAAVLAAVVVSLAVAGGNKVAVAEPHDGKGTFPPLETGRSYFFAYEFSGDARKPHVDTPRSVEGEYLGEQRGSWVKVRQTRANQPNERPTVFWVNLDHVAVIKMWPRDGDRE